MAKALTEAQIMEELKDYSEWYYDPDKHQLYTGIEFRDFKQAISFINAVAEKAEELKHHPDIYLYDYKFVQILTRTHDSDGVTEADLELAEAIDDLLDSQPGVQAA